MMDRRRLHTTLWVTQVVLALLFVIAGGVKLWLPATELAAQATLPVGFLRFVGVCEILGAVGLLAPGLTGIRPELTAIAAGGLVIIMVGAAVTTARDFSVAMALFPCVVGLACAGIAWGRWRAVPLSVRPTASG